MTRKIQVALLGLGEVGQDFAEMFLERIQEGGRPVEIAAVAHRRPDSPVALGFAQSGVPVFADAVEVTSLGEKIDIIFDLTGNPDVRRALREALQASGNRHTVIAPEVVAQLLWLFFNEGEQTVERVGGY